MEVIFVQSLTLIGLFLSMVFFTLLPVKLVRNTPVKTADVLAGKYETLISLANCLSGGVFLATFFIGLLPEVRQDMNSILDEAHVKSTLPVTEVVVLFGFFLAMFIEQIALTFKSDGHCEHGIGETDSGPVIDSFGANRRQCSPPDDDSNAAKKHLATRVCTSIPEEQDDDEDVDYNDDDDDGICIVGAVNEGYANSISNASKPLAHGHGHSHGVEDLLQSSSGLRFAILLLSLGVHSLFEGMALGLQTEVHTLLNLFLGVWIHECLIAFALGFSMAKLQLSTCRLCQIAVLFSSMIPVGQIIGIAIGCSESWTNRILNTFLQAIAAGTFIQITFLDIIPEGLGVHHKQNQILKVFLLFIGFLAIAVITFLVQMHQDA